MEELAKMGITEPQLSQTLERMESFNTSLQICKLSGFKNDITPEVLVFWAGEISKDFPSLTSQKLAKIIMKGIKGMWFEKPKYGIGLSTIYSWIEQGDTSDDIHENDYNNFAEYLNALKEARLTERYEQEKLRLPAGYNI